MPQMKSHMSCHMGQGLPDTAQVDWVENDSCGTEIVHFLKEKRTKKYSQVGVAYILHALTALSLTGSKKLIVAAFGKSLIVCLSSNKMNKAKRNLLNSSFRVRVITSVR